ncbi:cysteine proteinase [Daedalea quercina L-15889]|uniref:Cysteine proteinase n=1 Tax=Daedalea quercina L-15889 TaxID=1314783 RepID=A0A165Q3L0_9APHY|nr:cysteine proteinase [Daedalea quercina L-15889]
MAGSKRSKLKKALSPPFGKTPEPEQTMDDDALMDDLMNQLDSRNKTVQSESAAVLTEIKINKVADTPPPAASPPSQKQDSKSRHRARMERKAAAIVEQQAPSNPEQDEQLQREAAEEERAIRRICDEHGLEMFEINPDGHCLFSAIADQLALLHIIPAKNATYANARAAAAAYMLAHPNDFMPFLPSEGGEDGVGSTSDTGVMSSAAFERYCATMRDTGAWGGEPEIMALCSAYNITINVVQGGARSIVPHKPLKSPGDGGKVAWISYHRRMYGLGEHYNSLRPRPTFSETVKSVFAIGSPQR